MEPCLQEQAGSTRDMISEIVFNTSMTGYLEVLTDPSYAGQAVMCRNDVSVDWELWNHTGHGIKKSMAGWLYCKSCLVCQAISRCEGTIQDFLKEQDIPESQAWTHVL